MQPFTFHKKAIHNKQKIFSRECEERPKKKKEKPRCWDFLLTFVDLLRRLRSARVPVRVTVPVENVKQVPWAENPFRIVDPRKSLLPRKPKEPLRVLCVVCVTFSLYNAMMCEGPLTEKDLLSTSPFSPCHIVLSEKPLYLNSSEHNYADELKAPKNRYSVPRHLIISTRLGPPALKGERP